MPVGSFRKKSLEDEGSVKEKHAHRKTAVVKAIGLVLFIVTALLAVRGTGIQRHLTADYLATVLKTAGPWAPVAYVFVYAAGVCLFVPGTLLTAIAAAIFVPYLGFVVVWAGAMLGASLAFWIGRTLGRDFAASLIGSRLKRYDNAIERNGFATVLYLRLVYFPFTPMNFGMGLTKVRFSDYLWGTALGILVGTFVFTFFIGTVRDIWVSGQWSKLLSPQIAVALALFIVSFFIPSLVKRWYRKDSLS